MYMKDLKSTKWMALICLIMIIVVLLIIAVVTIVGVTNKLKKVGSNQEISQGTSQTTETNETTSDTSNGTKVTVEQIAENPEKYYGQEVKNYTKGDRVYRIFYVDTEGYFGEKNTVYLKVDWFANDVNLDNKGADTYTPKTTKILEKMNQEWAKERLNSTWNVNEHCVAWLCDPTTNESSSNQEWASYFDERKANYVIGSPSVEMFVKSYNQVSHKVGKNTLGAAYSTTKFPGYVYSSDGTESISNYGYSTENNSLDYEGYNNMYCGDKGTKKLSYTWLASPSALNRGYVCMVLGVDARLYANGYDNLAYRGVSPIVSLKTDFTPEI